MFTRIFRGLQQENKIDSKQTLSCAALENGSQLWFYYSISATASSSFFPMVACWEQNNQSIIATAKTSRDVLQMHYLVLHTQNESGP